MATHTCAICSKTEEAPMRMGADYQVRGEDGTVLKFWMCNPCAFPLGPQQGPINVQDPRLKV